MSDVCLTVILDNVLIQENGIIRNSNGYIIGRLVSDVPFNSNEVKGCNKAIASKEVPELLEAIAFINKTCGRDTCICPLCKAWRIVRTYLSGDKSNNKQSKLQG